MHADAGADPHGDPLVLPGRSEHGRAGSEQAELQAHDDAVPAADPGIGHDPQWPGRPRGQHDPRHGEQHAQAGAYGQRGNQP